MYMLEINILFIEKHECVLKYLVTLEFKFARRVSSTLTISYFVYRCAHIFLDYPRTRQRAARACIREYRYFIKIYRFFLSLPFSSLVCLSFDIRILAVCVLSRYIILMNSITLLPLEKRSSIFLLISFSFKETEVEQREYFNIYFHACFVCECATFYEETISIPINMIIIT